MAVAVRQSWTDPILCDLEGHLRQLCLAQVPNFRGSIGIALPTVVPRELIDRRDPRQYVQKAQDLSPILTCCRYRSSIERRPAIDLITWITVDVCFFK